jgi:ubiquinol-cytochrome c reductase cytochrome b subunit
VFPDHWSFLLGEVALFCFIVLVATGVFLTLFFRPDAAPVVYQGAYEPLQGREMSAAYQSVLRLSFEVRAGLVMRQTHHWAALVFIAAITMHLLRVFFTSAFRRPRELNWLVGIGLLIFSIGMGVTGYSLPDDLLSGTGLRIAYSVMILIPFIGPYLGFLIFGGEFPTEGIISRLFVMHVMLLPALIIVLITIIWWW